MPLTPTAVPEPRTSARPSRLEWADAAKGVTIVLVVLNHLVLRHHPAVGAAPGTLAGDLWVHAMGALDPVRMPLFFLLSGFFAAAAVRRPWRAVWRRRILRPYWLFAVWLLVHAAFFTFERGLPTTRIGSPGELLMQLLLPSSSLWFLYALAAYFAIAYGLRALPRAAASAAAGLGLAALVAFPLAIPDPLLRNLPFFLVGAYVPGAVRALAAGATRIRLAGLLAAYAALLAAAAAISAPLLREVAVLGASAAGVAAAVVALVLATPALPRLTGAAASVGRTTLPVYVLHLPALAILGAAATQLVLPGPLLLVYPLLATAAVVGACRAVHAALFAGSVTWLFDLPEPRRVVEPLLRLPAARPRFAA